MLIPDFKTIFDTIHGYIKLSNLACDIIDTVEFQRLKDLHQLGTCYFVFPSATHTRFEHSLGVYHLAGRLVDCIAKRTPLTDMHKYLSDIPELKDYLQLKQIPPYQLDDYIRECIKIAGLIHDLGHGVFSHLFDYLLDQFLL